MTITTASQPKDSAGDRESLHQRLWARASADHEMLDALEAARKKKLQKKKRKAEQQSS